MGQSEIGIFRAAVEYTVLLLHNFCCFDCFIPESWYTTALGAISQARKSASSACFAGNMGRLVWLEGKGFSTSYRCIVLGNNLRNAVACFS